MDIPHSSNQAQATWDAASSAAVVAIEEVQAMFEHVKWMGRAAFPPIWSPLNIIQPHTAQGCASGCGEKFSWRGSGTWEVSLVQSIQPSLASSRMMMVNANLTMIMEACPGTKLNYNYPILLTAH